MCNSCGDKKHKVDKRILKPKKGEMFSINANKIDNETANTINNFIRFARAHTKLINEPNDGNVEKLIKAKKKLFRTKKSGRNKRK